MVSHDVVRNSVPRLARPPRLAHSSGVGYWATFRGNDNPWTQTIVQVCSVLAVYGLNIAMQPLQSGIRAFLIDTCPAQQQALATAWWSRFSGLGSILIYLFGYFVVPHLAATTEFKALSVFGTLVMITTVATALLIPEAPQPLKAEYKDELTGSPKGVMKGIMRGLWQSLRTLPPITRKVCKVQLFAWLAWFSVLYYTSTYIYETFMGTELVHLDPSEMDNTDRKLIEVGRRSGIFACFCFALAAFLINLIFPWFLQLQPQPTNPRCNYSTEPKPEPGAFQDENLMPATTIFTIPLSRMWQLSNLLLAVCMFLTFFTTTVAVATTLVAVLGLSWGMAIWAPYALVGTELSYLRQGRLGDGYFSLSRWADSGEERNEEVHETAAIMGIHNMAIAIPQILSALTCAGVFKVAEMVGMEDGAAWAFRMAGCCALVATWVGGHLERGAD